MLGCFFSIWSFRIIRDCFGCPDIGENREAGEIPARSRHCDALEAAGYRATDLESGRPRRRRFAVDSTRVCETKSGDLPEAAASRMLSAREGQARGSTFYQAPARSSAGRVGRSLFFWAIEDSSNRRGTCCGRAVAGVADLSWRW